MTKPRDFQGEIVRRNLQRFREEAGMTQAQAAEFSGIAIDNLRRYESGRTAKVPGTVLAELGSIYGHSADDFSKENPPPSKPEERPTFMLRTRPGTEIDEKVYRELQAVIDKANRDVRTKKRTK